MNYPIQIERYKNSINYNFHVDGICDILGWNPDELDGDSFDKGMRELLENPFEEAVNGAESPNKLYKLELFHIFDTILSNIAPIENSSLYIPSWHSKHDNLDMIWKCLQKWNNEKETLSSHSKDILSESDIQKIHELLGDLYKKYSDKRLRTKMHTKIELETLFSSLPYIQSFTKDGIYKSLSNIFYVLSSSQDVLDRHSTSHYYLTGGQNKKSHIQQEKDDKKKKLTTLNELIQKFEDEDPKTTFNEIRAIMKTIFKNSNINIKASLNQLQESSKEYNLTHAYNYFSYILKTKKVKSNTSREVTITAKPDGLFINGENYLDIQNGFDEKILKTDFSFKKE